MSSSELWADIWPLLQQLIFIILGVVVPVVAKYLIANLKASMSESELKQAEQWSDLVVQFLEQVGEWRGMDNAQKKEYAVNALIGFGENLGLEIDRDFADMLVEAAVQRLKGLSSS